MAINPITQRGSGRSLYVWAAAVIPIVVLIGFARTYYLKGFFDTPPVPGLLVHLHGIVMTSWVILFVTQVSLVAVHRTRLHQRLGILGAGLAVIVVFVGVATAISAGARAVSAGRAAPGGDTVSSAALRFLVVPFGDMLVFAVLVGAALYFRRRVEIHKRLMLLAALNLLAPAIARIPLHFIATGGPLVFFGLTDVFILAAIGFDSIKHRRLHPAFLWATPLAIASQPLRMMLGATETWMRLASWITS